MQQSEEQAVQEDLVRPNLVHEFFVDFLGGLVPGILFVAATATALVPPLWALGTALSPSGAPETFAQFAAKILTSTQNTPNMIWIAAFVFMLILSYILGHLFYRRDPKIPDIRSFERISRNVPSDAELDAQYGGSITEWKRQSFGCVTHEDCQFPYRHLYDYLKVRGHDHLLNLVTWNNDGGKRSKTYINMLKVRLQFYFPGKFRRVIRNEAHVRLATSTWYAGRALFYVCGLALVISASSIGYSVARQQFPSVEDTFGWYAAAFIAPSMVWFLGWYCRRATEHFIHYQRLREAFYVLELAYTAFRNQPDLLTSPQLKFQGTEFDD